MKAIILCAGKGERMKPLTNNLPKPMLPIKNKPVLEYTLRLCKHHNINEIAINTFYLPEKITQYFGDGKDRGLKIRYSFEKELLGTSGALNNFRDFFKDTFAVIYGDNLTNLDLTEMIKFHKMNKSDATLFVYRESLVDEKTGSGYIVIGEDGRIESVVEKPNEEEKKNLLNIPEEKKFINVGMYILEKKILDLIPDGYSDFAKDIFPKLLKYGKIYGFRTKCYFKEVGQLMRYKVAKEDVESGRIKFDFI